MSVSTTTLRNELTQYNNYEKKVKAFKENLSKVIDYLEMSETQMKKGVYDDNNQTLDRGVLKNSYETLETIIGNIDNLIIKIQDKKNQIVKQIQEINRENTVAHRSRGLSSSSTTTSVTKKTTRHR